jgi:hypothetical protein
VRALVAKNRLTSTRHLASYEKQALSILHGMQLSRAELPRKSDIRKLAKELVSFAERGSAKTICT